VEDEAPIPVEAHVTAGAGSRHDGGDEPSGALGDGYDVGVGGRRATTTSRVVHGPAHTCRIVGAVVVAALAVVGVAVALGDATPGGPDGRDGADERPPTTGLEITDAASTSATYAEAALRLGRAGSFAYRGTVHATGPSQVRPGPWLAQDVTVEGAVRRRSRRSCPSVQTADAPPVRGRGRRVRWCDGRATAPCAARRLGPRQPCQVWWRT
jgi:hypothetical protein